MRLYNSISIIVAIGLMAILVSFSPSSSEEVAGNQICIDENIQNTLDTLLVERMAELNVPAAWGGSHGSFFWQPRGRLFMGQ